MAKRPIRGYPNYKISDTGVVYRSGKRVSLWINNRGYVTAKLLRFDGKWISRHIHVLVAKAFLDWWKGCVVHHIDHNKLNNRASNLECTSRATHASYHKNPASLDAASVRLIRKLHRLGIKPYAIAVKTGVSVNRVYDLLSGKTFARFEIRKIRKIQKGPL